MPALLALWRFFSSGCPNIDAVGGPCFLSIPTMAGLDLSFELCYFEFIYVIKFDEFMLLLPPNDFFVDARAEGEVLRLPPSCLVVPD
jgi:hypothetical protein